MYKLIVCALTVFVLTGCMEDRVIWNDNGELDKPTKDREIWDSNGKIDKGERKVWDDSEGEPVVE